MKKKNVGDWIFDGVIYIILTGLVFVCAYPVWYVLVASFCDSSDIARNTGLLLWPPKFDFGAYNLVFTNRNILNGFKNTLLVLGLGLPINIVMTLFCGYFLSCTNMYWKKLISGMIMFTMFFGGGMIPGLLNIRSLGLYNTVWSLILPGAMSVYNAIICKTAIEGIPESLKESAYVDGANDLQILFKVITPLIKATLAVLLLYYFVGHWNSWFNASIYIKDMDKLPLQNIIRSILTANSVSENNEMSGDKFSAYAETMKYAAIVVSTVPVMCVYPFLQKHFTKGVMIGAVKG